MVLEDCFFMHYHLGTDWDKCFKVPINERKWIINRFVQQKERERQAYEAESRKKR